MWTVVAAQLRLFTRPATRHLPVRPSATARRSGLSAFHVAVTGPTIVPTTGPTLKLTVFQVKVHKVSPGAASS